MIIIINSVVRSGSFCRQKTKRFNVIGQWGYQWNRLQNSHIFCEHEPIFERKVWSECKNGEGEWGETLPQTPCEARALHTRGSRLRRFAFQTRPKTTVMQSTNGYNDNNWLSSLRLAVELIGSEWYEL